ncbi:MAG: S24/S26 family peptidase [Clostridia bacterium]|nr:S24/S26 family peptidase [Clostridia bacterium]
MNYAEMLDSIITKSELSLRQIAKRCAELELSITPSYISQLRNGKLPPPTAEVSMILAQACNSKEESKLIFQGYLEKAPDVIKEYMFASSQLNKVMLESLCKVDGNSKVDENAIEYLRSLDILSTIEMSSKYITEGSIEFKPDLAKEITIASGGIANDKGDITTMVLGDNSMAPTIPVHSFIYILPTKTELLKSRDVIAFYPLGKRQAILRRAFFSKGKILLIPDDRSSEVYMIDSFEELNYLGKVISFRVDL